MTHPHPAEHDQTQAEALSVLREAESFVLIHFTDDKDDCENPFCELMHRHRAAKIIASCGSLDLQTAMQAIGEELMVTAAIETLMHLGPAQRDQIAGLLRNEEGTFLRFRDDEA